MPNQYEYGHEEGKSHLRQRAKWLGVLAGAGVGVVFGLTVDGMHFLPTVLDTSALNILKEFGESLAVTSATTLTGGAFGGAAGSLIGDIIEQPRSS
ncbi:MAG: hypothetical protein ACYCPS_00340 [Candidatus Saccharimonadales bacterium]